jgi:hypothetical protein
MPGVALNISVVLVTGPHGTANASVINAKNLHARLLPWFAGSPLCRWRKRTVQVWVQDRRKIGGPGRNRTGIRGFAIAGTVIFTQ